jgi:uroporphyrinogen-III decarboxylase
MKSLERVRNTLAGRPVDHLAAQPMSMMFSARNAGIPFIDYTRDGIKMAQAQLKLHEDFGIDCLLTCSDPAREVIDIAGEGSVDWFVDQGPAINEARAALRDKSMLKKWSIPNPLNGARMYDRIQSIQYMRKHAGPDVSIVGWVEGPLALAQELRGLNTIMMDFVDDPDFVTELFNGTADEVYEACRRCHQTCGSCHIVGAGCEISPFTPVENLKAMFAYAREHRPDEFEGKG